MSNLSASQQKYHFIARVFHWIGALLIVAAWFLIEQGEEFLSLHKAVGFSFLVWTVLRIVGRLITKAPPAVPMPKWQTTISHLMHLALYAVMILMPLTGLLSAIYAGYGVDVFGLFNIAGAAEPNRDLARLLIEIHEDVMWNGLIALVALHVAAALYHQFIMRDGLLRRML